MNINQLSNRLRYITLPLWVKQKNQKVSFCTGFIFNYLVEENLYIPFIVTNFHVVSKGETIITEFTRSENNEPSNKDKIKVEIPLNKGKIFGSEELDLYLIPISQVIRELKDDNKEIFYIGIDQNIIPNIDTISKLMALEEVVFIGYPNAIYDSKNYSPIIRRGITATPIWNDFDNKKRFLIDAGVYPGSSGSPVFIFNQGAYSTNDGISLGMRIFFIGVLTESSIGVLYENTKYFLGLGGVIKAQVLTEFIESVTTKIKELSCT